MAWKIFNIGAANKRIEELEAENTTLKQQLKASEDSVPDSVKALQGELATASASLSQANAELATAKQTVSTLTAEKEALAGQVTKLTQDIEAKGKEVEAQAAKKAAEIQASIGAPAAPVAPAAASPKQKTELTGMARVRAAARSDLQAGNYVPKN